jgi:L-aminopeptidase/D-esterase-like protein
MNESVDFAIPGLLVGHWTDEVARTGCTVLLFPDGTVGSGEVRGGAPATRDFELLDPQRTVSRLDAVVLSGGSAFGLGAAEGVLGHCARSGMGVEMPSGVRVPIVVGMSLYDLAVGEATVFPTPSDAAEAAWSAREGPVALGPVGAGTGATVGKWRGRDRARAGGIGGAVVRRGDLVVGALVAVNATGDIDDGRVPSAILTGDFDDWPTDTDNPFANTTIGVVVTNARLDKMACHLVSQSAHDGYARALFPAHTRGDGDAVVTAAVPLVDAGVDVVRLLAVVAVESAIRSVGLSGAHHRRDHRGHADA